MMAVPMIPEAVIAMLACTHLGAVHVVVFGGFAPKECAKRIDAAKPGVIVTASCGLEGMKRKIPYLPLIREAVGLSTHKPRWTVVRQRTQMPAVLDPRRNEREWKELVETVVPVKEGQSLRATDPHYILHTSGTTGVPKGVVRPLSHLVGLSYTTHSIFDFHPGATLLCASDIGWVVGHSYIVYSPLLAGAATILYEGKPTTTPDASSLWRMVEEYHATALYVAPSALRAILHSDPTLSGMRQHNLASLETLYLAGERSEPTLVERFQKLLPRVVDNWWSTEAGSPMTGLLPGQQVKPGSAGMPLPGWDVRVVDDDGCQLPPGEQGNIVVALPLPPTALSGLWVEKERFWNSYFNRFGGRYLDTGDVGVMDSEGYLTVLARGDDVINVSAHRLGTATIEGAIIAVPGVTDAVVVGMRDRVKGEVPVAFVVGDAAEEEVKAAVRREVGAIASLRAVVTVPEEAVPRTRSGKVQRRWFRGVLEGREGVPDGVEAGVWRKVGEKVKEMGLVGGAPKPKL
jgi:propionyl-CoA synthetase